MALEIIKNIAEAEAKSDNIKSQAIQEAERLKIEADNNGKDIVLKSRQMAKQNASKLIQESVDSAQDEVNSILSEADRVCSEIAEKAEQNMTKAVEAIVRKVVGINGNS